MGWRLGNEQANSEQRTTNNKQRTIESNELSLYSLRFRESRAIVEA